MHSRMGSPTNQQPAMTPPVRLDLFALMLPASIGPVPMLLQVPGRGPASQMLRVRAALQP